MKLNLSENIKSFRKERKMTQEKLAEALGVTVGAVYKWESGLSTPELSLIVEMADLFDTSVDVLLGYKMKNNRVDHIVKNINKLCKSFDNEAITEVDKALVKYPNSFEVLNISAETYGYYGITKRDCAMMRKSLDLFEKVILLLPQNTNPAISEATIRGNMANILFMLGETNNGLEILKKYNASAMYSGVIGTYMTIFTDNKDEAVPFLSEGLVRAFSDMMTSIVGYIFFFCHKKEWKKAIEINNYAIAIINGLRTDEKFNSLDKIQSELLAALSYLQKKSGKKKESERTFKEAIETAKRFDSNPDYSINSMRYVEKEEDLLIYDIFGAGAIEAILKVFNKLGDDDLIIKCKELI
ncbi:helix-turn-helix domain-containing protein [Butyrivibrio sp. INlla21]|uniref:helix-turn-helix domain-containing protein n=1 Tax=Butyrivibrio sp. INlla21 TaxID=1520811 RepID=UPI0008E4392C|nr:helix-turn-helix transcriptional regulator [Butyrivibrio sp. INlla21]SFV00137.1 DNA-binding transcriptional regulator, XRE-family HTH domain [Butyrivibrio sp. INlla21]